MTAYALMARFKTDDMALKPDLDSFGLANDLVDAIFDHHQGDGVIVDGLVVEQVCDCPPGLAEGEPLMVEDQGECSDPRHHAHEGEALPEGYRRPLDIRADLANAVYQEVAKHRQEHNASFGDSVCSCGGWDGPYTLLADPGEGSFAQHLADALEPLTARACGDAYGTGYYDGAEERNDDYALALEHLTDFPIGHHDVSPMNVARYVEHLEHQASGTSEPGQHPHPLDRLLDLTSGLVFGLRNRLTR